MRMKKDNSTKKKKKKKNSPKRGGERSIKPRIFPDDLFKQEESKTKRGKRKKKKKPKTVEGPAKHSRMSEEGKGYFREWRGGKEAAKGDPKPAFRARKGLSQSKQKSLLRSSMRRLSTPTGGETAGAKKAVAGERKRGGGLPREKFWNQWEFQSRNSQAERKQHCFVGGGTVWLSGLLKRGEKSPATGRGSDSNNASF